MLLNRRISIKYLFLLMWKELLGVCIVAGLITHYDEFFTEWWGGQFPIIPNTIPAMLGTMITLVLAFRMNQSYDRWWEGRKVWGGIVNDSRALIRQTSILSSKTFIDNTYKEQFQTEMIRLNIAWCYELVKGLRQINNFKHPYLTDNQVKELKGIDSNLPNAILFKMLQKIQEAFEVGLLNEYQQIKLVDLVNALGDSMGKSERIKNTVFPKLYAKLINNAIWGFVIILPLAFRDPNKYSEFPVTLLISMFFFTLEKMAMRLQDPFDNHPTDIPILDITRKIEINGLNVLGEKKIPATIEAKGFYLM